MKAKFQITFQNNSPSCWKTLRYLVVEGSGDRLRTVVSAHRSLTAANREADRWQSPANVEVIDRTTGEIV